MNFKEIITEELKKKGLSQTDLARKLDVTRQNINKLLKSNSPSIDFIEKIATALEIDRNHLVDMVYKQNVPLPDKNELPKMSENEKRELEVWKEKYYKQLEETNEQLRLNAELAMQLLRKEQEEKKEAQEKAQKL